MNLKTIFGDKGIDKKFSKVADDLLYLVSQGNQSSCLVRTRYQKKHLIIFLNKRVIS